MLLRAVVFVLLGELSAIKSQVGERLLIELTIGLDVFAFLELLDSIIRFGAPAPINTTYLEAVLVQRLLNLPHLISRQLVRRDRLLVIVLILRRN